MCMAEGGPAPPERCDKQNHVQDGSRKLKLGLKSSRWLRQTEGSRQLPRRLLNIVLLGRLHHTEETA